MQTLLKVSITDRSISWDAVEIQPASHHSFSPLGSFECTESIFRPLLHRLPLLHHLYSLINPIRSSVNCSLFSHPQGSIWVHKMNLQASERSLPSLSGIPLCCPELGAMFRFIWADIRPENDLRGREESCQPFCGCLDVSGSSTFISSRVTRVRWSVSSPRPAGTVSGVTETDRRWTSKETCHRLTRLPAGGLYCAICFWLSW